MSANKTQTGPDLKTLATEYLDLQTEIADRQSRLEHIKEVFLQRLPIGKHEDILPGWNIAIRAGARRLDTKKITEEYPIQSYPQLYVSSLSTPLVRKAFSPTALEEYETTTAPVVTVQAVK